jgi:hypothetical protein
MVKIPFVVKLQTFFYSVIRWTCLSLYCVSVKCDIIIGFRACRPDVKCDIIIGKMLQSMASRCEVWHHHRQDASEHAVQMWSVTSSSARCFRACRPDVKCDIIIDKMFQSMPSRCEVWHHHRQDVSEHAIQVWSVTSSSVSEHAVQMWSVTSSSARCFRACRPDENHDFSVILHLFVY